MLTQVEKDHMLELEERVYQLELLIAARWCVWEGINIPAPATKCDECGEWHSEGGEHRRRWPYDEKNWWRRYALGQNDRTAGAR